MFRMVLIKPGTRDRWYKYEYFQCPDEAGRSRGWFGIQTGGGDGGKVKLLGVLGDML